ncbi:RING finger protein 223 [Spea bombifrons]|uniref:RING finger protein 223 n=1 Tax=Spea bombifrons TaxID=233779 RepID=UPI00234913C7|nr:RING finger protein 223 [Spea bombifrons]
MDAPTEIWHTQVEVEEEADSTLECSICFTRYDNIFKTPKVLQCSHTFCLECVARLVAALPPESQTDKVLCPFCRQPTPIPQEGAPALQTSQELLANLPAHLQHEEAVWIEGNKLCYKHHPDSNSDSSQSDLCICVDIGLSKKDTPSVERRQTGLRGFCCGCSDWKRLLLIVFMIIVLFCILLWPVQCILKTGNLRCTNDFVPNKQPSPTFPVTNGK